MAIKSPINQQMQEYIQEHYPEYDTITTLKTDAMNDNYMKRVEKEVDKVSKMFFKENNRGIEI